MDSVSQFLMGSAMGQIILGPKHQGKGALIGGIAGTIPDLDVIPLIGSSLTSQLLNHRGLSHSLIFCVLMPPLLAWASKRWIGWHISFKRWVAFWTLAFITHVLLDLMTTWGTQIFWPHPAKIALDALFIIDPLLTFPLAIGCVLAAIKKHHRPAIWGVIITSGYMLCALGLQNFMSNKFHNAFEKQNIQVTSKIVRPTPFNTVYWAVTARNSNDELIMGYARLWDQTKEITFSEPIFQQSHLIDLIKDQADSKILLNVTKGYYVIKEEESKVIIQDARFGRLGGWMKQAESRFLFNYVFDKKSKQWTQYRPPIADMGNLLKNLWIQIVKN